VVSLSGNEQSRILKHPYPKNFFHLRRPTKAGPDPLFTLNPARETTRTSPFPIEPWKISSRRVYGTLRILM